MDLPDDVQIHSVVGEDLEERQQSQQLVGIALELVERQLFVLLDIVQLRIVDVTKPVKYLDDHGRGVHEIGEAQELLDLLDLLSLLLTANPLRLENVADIGNSAWVVKALEFKGIVLKPLPVIL